LNGAYPEKWRKTLTKRVQKGGVQLVLDDQIDDVVPGQDGTVKTRKGKKITADLVVRSYNFRRVPLLMIDLVPLSRSHVAEDAQIQGS
jgi:hypothetical protein